MNMKSKLALIVSYKENSMDWLKAFKTISLTLILGASLTACGAGKTSWKEEVLLHDGSKLIVERSQTYGGSHELGQGLPIKEHTISFTLPKSNKLITWKSEYGEELGRTNFNLLAVHVLNGTPYLVTVPNGCLSYNKWGRPNPPYIFLKYINQRWEKIPLSEFPVEFKEINMLIDTYGGNNAKDQAIKSGLVSSDNIKKLNNDGNMAIEYKTLLREPLKANTLGTDGSSVNCEERFLYKGLWILPNDPIARAYIDKQKR
jgi:hypothetical protein